MELNKNYLLMTVTFYWTGRVVAINPAEIVIEDAAQVFDLGELEHALKTGDVNICQAVPDGHRVFVPRNGTTALEWSQPLIRKSKRG